MPDKDGMPKSNKLPASLAAWAKKGDPNETQTVIFRIAPNADPDTVSRRLGELQVAVTSAGAAVVVGTVSRRNLLRAADVAEVVRIDTSRRLAPKGDEGEADILSPKGGKRFRLPED